MTKIEIERIHRSMVETKNGPVDTIGIKGKDGIWYTCFYKPQCDEWVEGQTVELEIEKKGDFHNIILPKGGVAGGAQLQRIEDKLDKVLSLLDPDGKISDGLSAEDPF